MGRVRGPKDLPKKVVKNNTSVKVEKVQNTYNDAFGYMDVTDDELGNTKEVKTIVAVSYTHLTLPTNSSV